jgi:flagellum-specific peptidoglycan hydrolase FlgJ
MPTPEQLQTLSKIIIPAALASEAKTGLPAEISICQCIEESAWFTKAPQNNALGIKSYAGEYGRQLLATQEWFTGLELQGFIRGDPARTAVLHQPPQYKTVGGVAVYLYDVQDWFATFPDLEACFTKHAELFSTTAYKNALTDYLARDYVAILVRAIAPIYATAPGYADSIISLMREQPIAQAIAEARAGTVTN